MILALVCKFRPRCLNISHTSANTRHDLLSSTILENPIHSPSVNVQPFFLSFNVFNVASMKLKKVLLSCRDKWP